MRVGSTGAGSGTLVPGTRCSPTSMLSSNTTIGEIMRAEQFLEYLHEHPATRALAEQLADVRAQRRHRAPAPVTVTVPGSRRIAS